MEIYDTTQTFNGCEHYLSREGWKINSWSFENRPALAYIVVLWEKADAPDPV